MKIKVIILEPMKEAYLGEIDNDLRSMQKAVGGRIEVIFPFENEVGLIVNEEGKINGLQLNRAIFDSDGKIIDIIAGTSFLCDCSGEEMQGLSDEHVKTYLERFRFPEMFVSNNGEIIALPLLG